MRARAPLAVPSGMGGIWRVRGAVLSQAALTCPTFVPAVVCRVLPLDSWGKLPISALTALRRPLHVSVWHVNETLIANKS